MNLERIDDLTLKARVISRLRRAILAGTLAPGALLSEREVAQQLGISRTPVREAFAALEREGLLTLSPHREVRVAEATQTQRDEACRLRAVLEGYALFEALRKDRSALVGALAGIVAEFARLAGRPVDAAGLEEALEQAWQLDIRFHSTIVQAAGDTLLWQVWQTRSMVTWMPATPRRFAQPDAAGAFLRAEAADHAGIAAAIQSAEVVAAVRLLAGHIIRPLGQGDAARIGLIAGLAALIQAAATAPAPT